MYSVKAAGFSDIQVAPLVKRCPEIGFEVHSRGFRIPQCELRMECVRRTMQAPEGLGIREATLGSEAMDNSDQRPQVN